jgi:Beta-lactamase class C and other penicillin binding proteins
MKLPLVILGFFIGAPYASAAEQGMLSPQISQAIENRIAAGEYPSVVIGIVEGDRSAVYAYGNAASGVKATGDTIYEIGSITKTFTATLLSDELERKTLSLDQPASTAAPGFSVPTFNGQAITFANLAEQNSGLPRMPDNIDPAKPDDPYADYGPDRLKAFLGSYALPRAPGAQYEYSNLAVGTLGYLLSQHAGMSYADLVSRKIFVPLGMTHTSVATGMNNPGGMATGHDFGGQVAAPWHFSAMAPAGGIRSTGNDMLRYLEANMGSRQTPLSAAMRDAHIPRADTSVPHNRIGLIWMTRHQDGGNDVVWHNGMTGGFASFIGFTTDHQHGVVILTNAAVKVDDIGFAVLGSDAPLARPEVRANLTPAQLEDYQGVFRLSEHMVLRVGAGKNKLLAQATGQRAIPLFASGVDAFFTEASDIHIDFKRDAEGKVNRLVLHQHGDHDAPKITEAQAATVEHITSAALDVDTLKSYVGQYAMDGVGNVQVSLEGTQLKVQVTGQPAVPIYASSKDHFFVGVVTAQIDFERDAGGRVTGMVLHQSGRERHGVRQAKAP